MSERIARFLGTARFLVYMTVFIVVWIGINVSPFAFDPYTFTFLTLLLSLQASYAAPLILLAQNRQADRDRISLDEDRATSERLQADVEYLSREVASLRQALGEVATRDFLRDQLREVTEEVVARTSSAVPGAGRRRPSWPAGPSARTASGGPSARSAGPPRRRTRAPPRSGRTSASRSSASTTATEPGQELPGRAYTPGPSRPMHCA